MPNLKVFHNYLKQHPHYMRLFFRDIIHVWWWKLLKHPIVVLTTESGGLGDYIWFRSYYEPIRLYYSPHKCHIIVIGMSHWEDYVKQVDADLIDIYRPFNSCDNPLKIEYVFFKLFCSDIFIDFRTQYLTSYIRSKKFFLGDGVWKSKKYYEEANNNTIQQWFKLPEKFKHYPPLYKIEDPARKQLLKEPFVVVVERGNTQGALSDEQLTAIIERIDNYGYCVFYNGDYRKINQLLESSNIRLQNSIIDGYSFPIMEYPYIISLAQFVITINTLIYHLAVQLSIPRIVISVNEYETIQLNGSNQIIIFNKELQIAYNSNNTTNYIRSSQYKLHDIPCERFVAAIDDMQTYISSTK